MKLSTVELRKLIRRTLVEMPVSQRRDWGSRDVDTRHPHLKDFAHRIDGLFKDAGIYPNIEIFDSGYVGLSIKFTGEQGPQGAPEKWLIVDQPGNVGLEDQSMGYIFFGPTGAVREENAWVWKKAPYGERRFGDVQLSDVTRQQTYDAILDAIDSRISTGKYNTEIGEI